MKKLQILIILIFCAGLFSVTVKSQTNLQFMFDSLIPKQTNLEQIEKILGKPDSQANTKKWSGKLRKDGSFRGLDYENTECRNDLTYGLVERNLYKLYYPALGLTLQVFDNPSNLYAVETDNAEISVLNIKVGDSLEKVENTLGKGEWQTIKGSEYWYLSYEKKGAQFAFSRDIAASQFPMKLAEKKSVVKIEVFDRKTHFVGCSKDRYE